MPSPREVHLRHAEVFLAELRSANEFYSDGGDPRTGLETFELAWGNVNSARPWASS